MDKRRQEEENKGYSLSLVSKVTEVPGGVGPFSSGDGRGRYDIEIRLM